MVESGKTNPTWYGSSEEGKVIPNSRDQAVLHRIYIKF